MIDPGKERYLKIAADLVQEAAIGEEAPVHLAGRARFDEVATRLSTARSALYRLWPSQRDYWRDLVTYAVLEPTLRMSHLLDVTSDLNREPRPPKEPRPEIVSDLASLVDLLRPRFNRAVEVLAGDAKHMIRAGLVGYPRVETLSDLAGEADRREHELAAAQLGVALALAGRRPIAPLTTLDLVIGLSLLLEGAITYSRVYPWFGEHRVVLDDETRPWSLAALAMRAVLTELTEAGEPHHSDPPDQPSLANSPDPVRPNWSAAEVKALEAGIEIVGDPQASPGVAGAEVVLGHVSLARVARAAGVTRRQMYNIWPSQSEFRLDLLNYLVEPERHEFFGRFTEAIEGALEAGQDRFVLELVEAINAFRRFEDDPPFDVGWALQPLLAEPNLAEWRRQARRELLDEFGTRVTALAQIWEAAPLDGLSVAEVSALNLMGSAGSQRFHIADPQSLPYDIAWRGGSYSLYAIVSQALMEHVLIVGSNPTELPSEPAS